MKPVAKIGKMSEKEAKVRTFKIIPETCPRFSAVMKEVNDRLLEMFPTDDSDRIEIDMLLRRLFITSQENARMIRIAWQNDLRGVQPILGHDDNPDAEEQAERQT